MKVLVTEYSKNYLLNDCLGKQIYGVYISILLIQRAILQLGFWISIFPSLVFCFKLQAILQRKLFDNAWFNLVL